MSDIFGRIGNARTLPRPQSSASKCGDDRDCFAPVAAVSPAPVAAAAPPVDWATGFELPKAPSAAEYNAPATLPVPPTVVQTPVAAQEYNAPVAEYNAPTSEYAAPTMPVVAGASP